MGVLMEQLGGEWEWGMLDLGEGRRRGGREVMRGEVEGMGVGGVVGGVGGEGVGGDGDDGGKGGGDGGDD